MKESLVEQWLDVVVRNKHPVGFVDLEENVLSRAESLDKVIRTRILLSLNLSVRILIDVG